MAMIDLYDAAISGTALTAVLILGAAVAGTILGLRATFCKAERKAATRMAMALWSLVAPVFVTIYMAMAAGWPVTYVLAAFGFALFGLAPVLELARNERRAIATA